MVSQYETEFLDAIDRSKRLGYDQGSINSSSFYKEILVDEYLESFLALLQNFFGRMKPEEVSCNCLRINLSFQQQLERNLGISSFYTLGSFEIDGKRVCDFTEDNLNHWTKHGVPDVMNANLHAWLTLESLEIIDITLPTSMGVVNNDPELVGSIFNHLPDDLPEGVHFHPVIIGSDILLEIGAMGVVA